MCASYRIAMIETLPTPTENVTNIVQGSDAHAALRRLQRELDQFTDMAVDLLPRPGELPRLESIDVYGGTLSYNGVVGGDHIIYVDFKQRFDLRARIARAEEGGRNDVADNLRRLERSAGIAIVDVSGHRVSDALLAAVFHQTFLVGAGYELDASGQITRHLFENLNTRFHQSSGAHKFISLLYGEISDDSTFRFLSAGHPFPAVFSNRHDRFMEVSPELCVSFPPLGIQPTFDTIDRKMFRDSVLGFKDHYETNEWTLMGAGDILLLHTDGLTEHASGDVNYFPDRLEQVLRRVKHQPAREIHDAILADLLSFAAPADDVSFVVVKKLM
jgi:serine phosphatase RsbU (regulator of sigma subunit)